MPAPARVPGELVQSVTYRESYAPPAPLPSAVVWPPGRDSAAAPAALRAATAAGWALLQLVTALSLAAVVLALLVRVLGALA